VSVFGWSIAIDREATAAAYQALPAWDCTCTYCRNYVAFCELHPEELPSVFGLLPISAAKASHVSRLCTLEDGAHLYDAMYHFVGCVVAAPDPAATDIDAAISFTDNPASMNFVPQDWVPPIAQLDVGWQVPWVLEELAEVEPPAQAANGGLCGAQP